MLKYMLDTNIVIYVMKRRPLEVLETFNRHAARLCVSSITAAELYYGAEKSAYPERAELGKTGRLIGENDLHIAAHARSEGLVLVSNNLREFERVDGLRLENWV